MLKPKMVNSFTLATAACCLFLDQKTHFEIIKQRKKSFTCSTPLKAETTLWGLTFTSPAKMDRFSLKHAGIHLGNRLNFTVQLLQKQFLIFSNTHHLQHMEVLAIYGKAQDYRPQCCVMNINLANRQDLMCPQPKMKNNYVR